MSRRSHLFLRLAALALLAGAAAWPRSASAPDEIGVHPRGRTRVAARAETTSARQVSAPRTTKLVATDSDRSSSTN